MKLNFNHGPANKEKPAKRSRPWVLPLGIGSVYVLFLLKAAFTQPVFCDEYSFLYNHVCFVSFKTLVPYYTNYPTLYSYLVAIPFTLVFLVLFFSSHLPWTALHDPYLAGLLCDLNVPVLLVPGRLISVLGWFGIMVLTYRFSRSNFGPLAAILSPLLIMIDPYRIFLTESRHALPDVPVSFLALSVFVLCHRYLTTHKTAYFYYAVMLTAAAAGMKLNGSMLLIVVLFTPLCARTPARERCRLYPTGILLFILVFLMGSPYLILKPALFYSWLDVEAQLLINQQTHQLPFQSLQQLAWGAFSRQPIFTLLLLAGAGYSALKHTQQDKLFLAVFLPSILIYGMLDRGNPVYLLFLYPLAVIQLGRLGQEAYKKISRQKTKKIYLYLLLFLLGACTLRSLKYLRDISRPDNRNIAYQWIQTHIPEGSSVLLDWAYVPDIEPNPLTQSILWPKIHTPEQSHADYYRALHRQFHNGKKFYAVQWLYNIGYRLEKEPAMYLITSSFCYQRYLTATVKTPATWGNAAMNDAEAMRPRFYNDLFSGDLPYKRIKTFAKGSGPTVLIFQKE